jgi:hypothetical protein
VQVIHRSAQNVELRLFSHCPSLDGLVDERI